MIEAKFVVATFCGGPAGHELEDRPRMQACGNSEHARSAFEASRQACRASFEHTVDLINDPKSCLQWIDAQGFYVCVIELPREILAYDEQCFWQALASEANDDDWSCDTILSMMREVAGASHDARGPSAVTRIEVAERVLEAILDA